MNTSRLNILSRCSLSVTLLSGLLVGCGGSIPTPASNAATTTTVTLQGQLTDAVSGQAIAGAKIEIGVRSAITDANGHYELSNVPANSGSTVSRDYQATLTLTGVTSPINMTNAATSPRYPDRKFAMPVTPAAGVAAANHDFKVGKLSATISGVVGDSGLLPVASALVELQDNTAGMVGSVIRSTTANATTGAYSFVNVEAGVDYKLVGRTSDGAKQGSVTTGKLSDNQTLSLPLSAPAALLLSNTDNYSPRIISVSPDNNADITPGAVNIVLTFNEAIKQDAYSIPNASVPNNVYHDINVSYGGQKAAGNVAHTLSWNATFDVLTITLPVTGVSSKFSVDLSLLSPIATTTGGTTTTTLGKLKDNAGNGLEKSPVLTNGNLLAFTTNGGALATAPVILSPNAAGLDSNASSVTLDWLPATGATKGYNIYRSIRTSIAPGIAQPFILIAGPIAASTYIDATLNLLPTSDAAQSYAYRVNSINSDLIESAPSNELLISDVVAPTVVSTAGVCVAPGGTSMSITSPVTITTNGQVKFTFSEALAVAAAETLANYTGVNISAVKLTTPTTVVLDFSAPITCVNTNIVVLGTGIADVAGNVLGGTVVQRTLTFVP